MALLKGLTSSSKPDVISGYLHWCPGCQGEHFIPINQSDSRANWTFNGNLTRPTFNPSVRLMDRQGKTTCHYFIRDGMIDFCGDSPHALKGQKVPLPEIPEENDEMNFNLNAGGKGPVDSVDEKALADKAKAPGSTAGAAGLTTTTNVESDAKPAQNAGQPPADEPTEIREHIAADPPQVEINELGGGKPVEGRPDTEGAIPTEQRRSETAQPANEEMTTSGAADEASAQANRDPNSRPEIPPPGAVGPGSAETQGAQAQEPAKTADDSVIFSSSIERLRVGRYQFENGQLRLTRSESEKFDKILETVDARTRNQIIKVDIRQAEAWLERHRATRVGRATKSIDSVDPLSTAHTQVGTKPLIPSQDQNNQ